MVGHGDAVMRFVLCAINAFVGALLVALPNMTRRELLFAVPVPRDFRNSRAGRHAISAFRAAIAVALVIGECALLFSPAKLLGAAAAVVPFAILLTAAISFAWQHRKLAPAAVQFIERREAVPAGTPEKLPRSIWLAGGPFVLLAAAATWLHSNWDRIPTRFPVHFGVSGEPNRWADRTTQGVYGPLLFGAELCGWLAIMAIAGWFGS